MNDVVWGIVILFLTLIMAIVVLGGIYLYLKFAFKVLIEVFNDLFG